MKNIVKVSLFVLLALCTLYPACSKGEKTPAEKTLTKTDSPPGVDLLLAHYESLQKSSGTNNYQQAIKDMEAIKEAVWSRIPFSLNNAVFVKGPDNSYGIYEPEDDDTFSPGETIYLYLEPAGYKIIKQEAGYYEFNFTADFQLVNENGEILGGQEQFASLPFKSWNPNKEISLTFNYHFTGLPAGKYKLITIVHDLNSGQKATVEKQFLIS